MKEGNDEHPPHNRAFTGRRDVALLVCALHRAIDRTSPGQENSVSGGDTMKCR